MTVEVPDEFTCPITIDVMTNPVRANCVEEIQKKTTPFFSRLPVFSRFYTTNLGDRDSCKGHYFERNALAAHLRKNNNCPSCNQKITKAVPDEKLAKRIFNEFASKYPIHFQAAKNEVYLNYGDMENLPIIPGSALENSHAKRAASSIHSSFDRSPRPYRRTPLSDVSSHSISEHLKNNNFALAEKKADEIISSYYRDEAYKAISENFLCKYTSRLNTTKSTTHLTEALRIISKITNRQMRNDLYFKIIKNIFSEHLRSAIEIYYLITDIKLKDKALTILVDLYPPAKKGKTTQEAEQIIDDYYVKNFYKETILNKCVNSNIYIGKLKHALFLNNYFPSSNTLKDENFKKIAKAYIDRNFNDKNFKKALLVTNMIQEKHKKDSSYVLIVEKAAYNKAYSKAYKTISKISKLSKRLGLYVKVSCIMLFFGFFTALSFPFKLGNRGLSYLLAKF